MVTLNRDCWHLVFQQLEPETRTLYSCLFVSKEFFHFSTIVLYRNPFQVFKNQLEFSSFSTTRLTHLLELCSGFTNPTCPRAAEEIQLQHLKDTRQQLEQRQNHRWTQRQVLEIEQGKRKSIRKDLVQQQQQPWKPDALVTSQTVNNVLDHGYFQNPIRLPTTIKYHELVKVYPKIMSSSKGYALWQHYFNCFAESINVLYINSEDFGLVLPLVARFRELHTLNINVRSSNSSLLSAITIPLGEQLTGEENGKSCHQSIFGNEYLERMITFLQLHDQLFPKLLKKVNHCQTWKNWQDVVEVSNALGGFQEQEIGLQSIDPVKDLSCLMVSRLKRLKLDSWYGCNLEGQRQVIKFLKRCLVLETLEISWSKTFPLDWNLWLEEEEMNENGVYQQQRQGSRIGLKHLILWEMNPMSLQAMQVFKDSLESIIFPNSHRVVHVKPTLHWKELFHFPRLKSLQLSSVCFAVENLSCCSVLETLVLISVVHTDTSCWPMSLPMTLRTLDLTETSTVQFDILLLKSLHNLEYLRILGGTSLDQTKDLTMINMSHNRDEDVDVWWFPKLKEVDLSGRFAIQIQGQILWAAPKLERLTLCLYTVGCQCPLDTDTFLCPPEQLDFKGQEQLKARAGYMVTVTTTIPRLASASTTTSPACFPSLTHLALKLFHTPKFDSGKAFGNVFFGRRGNEERNDGGLTLLSNLIMTERTSENKKGQDSFIFPNLEQVCFSFNQVHDLDFFQPTVLVALQSLPKLELFQYLGKPLNSPHEYLDQWLEPVVQNQMWKYDSEFRNRPLVVHGEGIGASLKGDGKQRKSRCVVEFDVEWKRQYQLKAIGQNEIVVRKDTKTKRMSRWKKLFSR